MGLKDLEVLEDEQISGKIVRKAKESPFVFVGIAGLLGSCAYGIFRYKTKGPTVTTSAFLMQLRVAAQGTFIACVMVGMTLQLLKDTVFKEERKDQSR